MKTFYRLILFSLLITAFGCGHKNGFDSPQADELENYIREKQDHRAIFTYAQYEELLKFLSDTNFIVVPINELRDSINDSKIMFGLRHDVDCNPYKALEMARMESKHNIRSSFYILATAEYYGKYTPNGVERYRCLDTVYKEISSLGCEIGVHNDLMAIMIKHKFDPFVFNQGELDYYKSIGITVNGTVAHGSDIACKTAPNFQIFSDYAESDSVEYEGKKYKIGLHSMAEFGFDYEANFIPHNMHFTDSGGKWKGSGDWIDGSFDELMENLKKCKPGARVQMLAHPVWWGKK